MKRMLFAFAVLMLLGSVSAASIDVEENVPANTVWTFSVNLPSGHDFDDAKVYLDGSRLISFYTNPSNEIVAYDEDSARLFSSTEPVGNKVYFLVSPMEEGEHRIKLKVDDSTEDEEEIEFFEIYDAESNESLKQQVDTVKGSVGSLIRQFNDLEEEIGNALTQEDKQALESSISSVQSSVSELEAKMLEQEENDAARANVLLSEIEDLKDTGSGEILKIGTGFASLVNVGPEVQAGVILALIAVGAAVLLVKFRDRLPLKQGLYGKGSREGISFTKKDEDIAAQVMEESQDEASSGKWAFGDSRPVKKERKGFSIGDLIKKD